MAFRKDPADDLAQEMVKRLNQQQTKHNPPVHRTPPGGNDVLGDYHKDATTEANSPPQTNQPPPMTPSRSGDVVRGETVTGQKRKSRGPMADSTLSEDEKRAEREAKNPPV
jgi:hypothetical protein